MIGFGQQSGFFKLIGSEIRTKVECFVIGGSAMMFYGAKEKTKDVDMVFMDKADLDLVKKALQKIGFQEKKSIMHIFKRYEEALDKPVMMVRGDDRFDLFLRQVITFEVSDSIRERVKEVHEFGNLLIKVVSPEDIILLKCATEREKDRIDAVELIKKYAINWDIIIEESLRQMKEGQKIFPVFLYDFLTEIKEDFKADIPTVVIRKIRKLAENEMIRVLKGKSAGKKGKRKAKV